MDRPGVRQVPEGSGEQGKLEKSGCKIICGAPTTLAVKGLMMVMMMKASETWETWIPGRSLPLPDIQFQQEKKIWPREGTGVFNMSLTSL